MNDATISAISIIIAAIIGAVSPIIVEIIKIKSLRQKNQQSKTEILLPSKWAYKSPQKSNLEINWYLVIGFMLIGGVTGYVTSHFLYTNNSSNTKYEVPYNIFMPPPPFYFEMPELTNVKDLEVDIKYLMFGSRTSVVNRTSLPGKLFLEENETELKNGSLHLKYNSFDLAEKTILELSDDNYVFAMFSSYPSHVNFSFLVSHYEKILGNSSYSEAGIVVWQDPMTLFVVIDIADRWVQTGLFDRFLYADAKP